MPISSEQIDLWRQFPRETKSLEFKQARNQLDTSTLSDYCVAIANEGGGHLVLGVTDDPPREVVGTKAFPNPSDIEKKLFERLGFRVNVDEVNHDDGRVVVFVIPSRPRGTAYNHRGRYLMRSSDTVVSMSEDVLRDIFAEGRPDWLQERDLSGLSATDVVELLDTQSYFELLDRPYPTTQSAVIERLVADRLVEGNGGSYSILRIGALLLAKNLSSFAVDVARKAPRLVVYNGIDKLDTRLDIPGGRGYAVGFQGLVNFTMSQLPQNEVIENALRRNVKILPETAVRELIANALIHQDFGVGGSSTMIEVFSNRLEISNPGKPIVPVARFIDGYQSRNERLADLMRRMGICEEKSSGIDRVIRDAEVFQLPAPDFVETQIRTVVTVYGPKSFDDMDRQDRIRACYQHCALNFVVRRPTTNSSLRERFGLSKGKSAIVSQILSATVDEGLIKPDEAVGSSRKFSRYVPFWA